MSVPVDLVALESTIEELGVEALLVTVTPDGRPHIVSVLVTWVDGSLQMGAGDRTRSNVATNTDVTLIWPTLRDGSYRLIVDGTAFVPADDDPLVVTPTFAVLHRSAGTADDGPTCVPIARALPE